MTERQKTFLKIIIEEYIRDGAPVASNSFLEKTSIKYSSATVRAEMNKLEALGFLEKTHTSSGRVPTTKALEEYAREVKESNDKNIKKKLEEVFARRNVSIDFTLDEAAKTISEIADFTVVTSSSEVDEELKSIQLTPLNESAGTVVIVTSTGRVESKLIEFNDQVKVDDVRIAIRVFKDRLVDTRLRELPQKVNALKHILQESIKNFEAIIQQFITKVFTFHEKQTKKVYGNSNLITNQELSREEIANLFQLMEKNSIWSSIEGKLDQDETLKIDVRSNNTTIVSKKLTGGNGKEISIVGTNRMNYSNVKQVIGMLEEFLGNAEGGKDE